jgi:hypothetical protein
MLKFSAFYRDNQKSFVPKKNELSQLSKYKDKDSYSCIQQMALSRPNFSPIIDL